MLRRLACGAVPLYRTGNLVAVAIPARACSSKHSAEDSAELERERALREKFAQKVSAVNGGAAAGGSNQSQSQQQQQQSQQQAAPRGPTMFTRVLFFITSIYMLLALRQIENPDSPVNLFQGIPWWQLPTDTVAITLLSRALLPFSMQRTIRSEFEKEAGVNPLINLHQFMALRHPTALQGNRVPQEHLIGAASACLAVSGDAIRFAQTISTAAGNARDARKSADDVMEALVREFPQVFAPPPPPPPQPQQQFA